jgi:hypothetical protein
VGTTRFARVVLVICVILTLALLACLAWNLANPDVIID